MATVLGKRKHRPTASDAVGQDDAEAAAIQDVFRRHFEAQFKPLKVDKKKTKKTDQTRKGAAAEEDSDEEESAFGTSDTEGSQDDDASSDEWDGLSGDEEEEGNVAGADSSVQIVDYSGETPSAEDDSMTKQERRAFLSSRPPSAVEEPKPAAPKSKRSNKKSSEFKDAPEMLANDLALQRLIEESHLLAGTRVASMTAAEDLKSNRPFATGRLRQKALDLRVQTATQKGAGRTASGVVTGSHVGSIFTQKSMPMQVRKGIAAAAAARESKRRREAKESGIVLERPSSGPLPGKKAAKRLRAVDAPAVGKLRGSELKLTARDVRAIEGPKKDLHGKKKKKKRR